MACPWGSSPLDSVSTVVFAENGLSEELSGAPDSLVDFRTGEKCEGVAPVENTGTGKEIFKRRVVGPPK